MYYTARADDDHAMTYWWALANAEAIIAADLKCIGKTADSRTPLGQRRRGRRFSSFSRTARRPAWEEGDMVRASVREYNKSYNAPGARRPLLPHRSNGDDAPPSSTDRRLLRLLRWRVFLRSLDGNAPGSAGRRPARRSPARRGESSRSVPTSFAGARAQRRARLREGVQVLVKAAPSPARPSPRRDRRRRPRAARA